jgi:hypothetical protein
MKSRNINQNPGFSEKDRVEQARRVIRSSEQALRSPTISRRRRAFTQGAGICRPQNRAKTEPFEDTDPRLCCRSTRRLQLLRWASSEATDIRFDAPADEPDMRSLAIRERNLKFDT